jgi:hypothetical protein
MSDVMAVQMALLNAKRALNAAHATTDSQWIGYAHDDISQAFSIIQTWYGVTNDN